MMFFLIIVKRVATFTKRRTKTPKLVAEDSKVSKTKTSVKKAPRVQLNAIPKAPTETGIVFVWGTGEVGQLGLGDQYDLRKKPYPLQDRGFDHPVDVVAGSLHNLVFTKGEGVFSWGVNDHGALGRPVNKGICNF